MRSIVLMFMLSFQVEAATFYVATNGNDSWNGTSPTFVSGTTGPYLTFQGWNAKTAAGDTLMIRGGIYLAAGQSTAYTIRHLFTHTGTEANPIIITNYPGEVPILLGSGTNNSRIHMNDVSWVNIYGIVVSNAYRSVNFQGCANCEFAYCTITGVSDGGTSPAGALDAIFYDSSQRNWFHHNTIYATQRSSSGDAGHGISFGLFYTTTDATAFNIIESNICYYSGHDTMSVYGSSNLVRGNFMHNEAWYFRQDWMTNAGHRCLELGGQIGNYNVVDSNRLQNAAVHGGAHGVEVSSGVGQIIRFNQLLSNDYSGVTLYGKGFPCGSNRVYGNTIAWNGWGPRYQTNYDASTNVSSVNDHINWKYAVSLTATTNNFFLNNIIWTNSTDDRVDIGGTVPGGYRWESNFVSNPLFTSYTHGGAFSQSQPDVRLTATSPAIDKGTWLTTITSSTGSGTSFVVADAGYFFAGLTASTRTVPGDTIQLQGQTTTATITGMSGNTITVSPSISWTQGDGVAMPYFGSTPDAGAFEYIAPSGAAMTIGPGTTLGSGMILR